MIAINEYWQFDSIQNTFILVISADAAPIKFYISLCGVV